MNKIITVIWISLLSVVNAYPIDTNTALTVAQRFLQTKTTMQTQKSNPKLQLVYQAVSHRKNADPLTYFYIYNNTNIFYSLTSYSLFLRFFQAEDGIRDKAT